MKTGIVIFLLVAFIMPLTSGGQLAIIQGSIVSKKSGKVLENVNILETGSGIGTISNSAGIFRLMLNPGNTELLISYDGFKSITQKIQLRTDTVVNFKLEPELNLKVRRKENVHASLSPATEKK